MKFPIKWLFVAVTLFVSSAVFADAELGKDYTVLKPEQPTGTEKIKVLEFFFYGCTDCFDLHPQLSAWEKNMPKDVELILVPTALYPSGEPMMYAFYALDNMGERAKLHDMLYNAWNREHLFLTEVNRIADFVAHGGVDRARFMDSYNSFSVQAMVKRSKRMAGDYKIDVTPSLVVDGKYVIQNLKPAEMIRVLNEVIVMARKEHKRR